MNLFVKEQFVSHAGNQLEWKIECDALTDEDIECLAFLASRIVQPFRNVIGVPRGGYRIADAMRKYADFSVRSVLVVDDVYTTGVSMNEEMGRWEELTSNLYGLVLFNRGIITDSRIQAVFHLNEGVT